MVRGQWRYSAFAAADSLYCSRAPLQNKVLRLQFASMWSRLKGKIPSTLLEPSKGSKTISLAVGYFIVLNYVVGNGFFGIAFIFYHAGMFGSIAILLFIMFMEWNSARWLFEVMSRAQVGLVVNNGLGSRGS